MNKIFNKYTLITAIYCIFVLFVYPNYKFLVWNMFLAYIPFLLSFGFGKLKFKILEYINIFVALIFYPNAIYLFTDLIHISRFRFFEKDNHRAYIMDFENWLKLGLIFVAVIIALKLSYFAIKNYTNRYKKNEYIIYIVVSLLVGIGVFLGRFIRLNSWDLFTNPIDVFFNIIKIINVENIKYILLFAFIQLIIILIENE